MSREPGGACPICGAGSGYLFTSHHDRRIFECLNRSCGHFFTPVIHEGQGICVRDADVQCESDRSLHQYAERNTRLLTLFLDRLGPRNQPIVFLDYGAGDGHVSRTIKAHLQDRCVVYCLEPNAAFNGFYERYGLRRVDGVEALREPVDLAFMVEVVEHLEDPVGALRRLRGALKMESGRTSALLFLSTPEGSRYRRETHAYDTPSHLHFFTARSLNLALRAAGFEEIEFRRYPEMYPRGKGLAARTIGVAKDLLRPLAWLLLRPHVKHKDLAGFTRPRE